MKRLLALLSLLFATLAPAYANNVQILLSEDKVGYHQLAEDIKNHIGDQQLRFTTQIITLDSTAANNMAPTDLIVSIGEAAVLFSKRQ